MNYDIKKSRTFTAKKFRLPVKNITYTIDGITVWSKKCNLAKEFSNPNAEQLFNQAQQAADLKERARLLEEMGDFELVDMNLKKGISDFLQRKLP